MVTGTWWIWWLSIQLGISSSQLTNICPSFFRGGRAPPTTNQILDGISRYEPFIKHHEWMDIIIHWPPLTTRNDVPPPSRPVAGQMFEKCHQVERILATMTSDFDTKATGATKGHQRAAGDLWKSHGVEATKKWMRKWDRIGLMWW